MPGAFHTQAEDAVFGAVGRRRCGRRCRVRLVQVVDPVVLRQQIAGQRVEAQVEVFLMAAVAVHHHSPGQAQLGADRLIDQRHVDRGLGQQAARIAHALLATGRRTFRQRHVEAVDAEVRRDPHKHLRRGERRLLRRGARLRIGMEGVGRAQHAPVGQHVDLRDGAGDRKAVDLLLEELVRNPVVPGDVAAVLVGILQIGDGEAARRRRLAQIVLGDHLRRRIACRREHQQRGLRNCCAAGKSGRKAKRQARHRKGNLHRHGYPVEVQDRGRSDRSKCKRTLGPGAARNACAK